MNDFYCTYRHIWKHVHRTWIQTSLHLSLCRGRTVQPSGRPIQFGVACDWETSLRRSSIAMRMSHLHGHFAGAVSPMWVGGSWQGKFSEWHHKLGYHDTKKGDKEKDHNGDIMVSNHCYSSLKLIIMFLFNGTWDQKHSSWSMCLFCTTPKNTIGRHPWTWWSIHKIPISLATERLKSQRNWHELTTLGGFSVLLWMLTKSEKTSW